MKTFLIDDDYISNFVTEKVLTDASFSENIRSFLSAEEALDFLKSNMPASIPDVIFLDLNMPGMNGWDFLEELEPYREQLKDVCSIYILTSSLDMADTARSEEYDLVQGLLHKPIDHQDVEVILAELKDQE